MSEILIPLTKPLAKVPEELKVYDLEGKVVSTIKTPPIFYVPVRIDLIRRAFLSAFTAKLQPKGRDFMAGKRTSAESLGVGLGLARIPRQKGGIRGRFVVSTVGGRRAFPPTPKKKVHEEINKKERRLAIVSALAAIAIKEFVEKRGHRLEKTPQVPVIVDDKFSDIATTKELRETLKKLGLWDDVERARLGTKIRAGKGKMRGRRYKTPISLLIISHKKEPIIKAAKNLPGVDVATPETLSILHLAPGGVPGRLTVMTQKALQALTEKFKVKIL